MLTVYLETSDFSYFAKVRQGKGKPEHEKILESLLNFKNKGLVDFRYSSVHMAGFLNTNKNDLKGNLENWSGTKETAISGANNNAWSMNPGTSGTATFSTSGAITLSATSEANSTWCVRSPLASQSE